MQYKIDCLARCQSCISKLKKPSFEQNCFAWLKKCFMKNLMIANRRQDELQRQSLLLYAYTPGDNGNIYCDQI